MGIKIGYYAGSFDPYTDGHDDVMFTASKLFLFARWTPGSFRR